jgi:hypothetical protein
LAEQILLYLWIPLVLAMAGCSWWLYYETKARPWGLFVLAFIWLGVIRIGILFPDSFIEQHARALAFGDGLLQLAALAWMLYVIRKYYRHGGSR